MGEGRSPTPGTHSLVKALRTVPSLDVCDDDVLLEIVGDSVNLFWPEGAPVFERDSPADALFIVLSGAVSVIGEDGREVARLGPGDHFGELSLLLGTTRRRAVVAAEPAELMIVPKDRFDALLAEHPRIAEAIRRTADERMQANRDSPKD